MEQRPGVVGDPPRPGALGAPVGGDPMLLTSVAATVSSTAAAISVLGSVSANLVLVLVGLDIGLVLGGVVLVEHVGVIEGILTGEHPVGLVPVDLVDPVTD